MVLALTFYHSLEWSQYCWYRQRHTAALVVSYVK